MDAQALDALKQKAGQEIDRISARLWKIALDIHSRPETGWDTPKAVRWLTEPLEEAGMKTEIGVAGVPSSFLAEWSGGGERRPSRRGPPGRIRCLAGNRARLRP